MLLRVAQMAVAILGMALILHFGILRDPGWGEYSSLHPVRWTLHWVPLSGGILCLAAAFAGMVLLGHRDS